MNRLVSYTSAYLVLAMHVLGGCNTEAPRQVHSPPVQSNPQYLQKGEALFKQNCSPCHPDGGNVSDPQRTLHGPDLRAHQITKPEDIVRIMRNPLSRMIRFDTTTISDQDARAIAVYVLTSFH